MYKQIAKVMEDKDILKEAKMIRNVTQTALAQKLGIVQSALSMNMTRDRMGLDQFKRILNAMDYDVAVIDRKTGEVKWIVAQENEK